MFLFGSASCLLVFLMFSLFVMIRRKKRETLEGASAAAEGEKRKFSTKETSGFAIGRKRKEHKERRIGREKERKGIQY